MSEKPFYEEVIELYRANVQLKHPDKMLGWPIVSGRNVKYATYRNYVILILEHTGNPVFKTNSGIGELPQSIIGFSEINQHNINEVRERLERHFSLKTFDGIIFIPQTRNIESELSTLLCKHEYAMGLAPMKIFLSHKWLDKEIVRDFKNTLVLFGFDPWLDEDAMHAGEELDRSILRGFNESCAAVFFVTKNFKDESFLGAEVNYAIAEKRKKRDNFSIITLIIGEGNDKGSVPALLEPYVWKEPKSDLEALREIIRALPLKVGMVQFR